jgi:hypothetical protein
MNRGVIVGGGLIAASFLVAITLNRSAHEESTAPQAVRPAARVCADLAQRSPTSAPVRDGEDDKCAASPAAPASK